MTDNAVERAALTEAHAWEPGDSRVFVFGSNLAGRHGKGAALFAVKNCGAKYGIGEGRMGDSYALPTKGHRLETLSLEQIKVRSVHNFLCHARAHPADRFFVTRIGCGLAGYCDSDIAPMFADAPNNCDLPPDWRKGQHP